MAEAQAAIAALRTAIREVVRGKDEVVDLAIVTVISGGHLLVEDVPGVGKTTLAAALCAAVGGTFSRIQLTSDLLPGDITGTTVLDPSTGAWSFRKGPIFANVVLADELNRATPRTQSALFEAMEEGAVTVDGVTHPLPEPFLVIATQNPFDAAGTFALPDSQLDRFALRVALGYPDRDAERAVLRAGRLRRSLPGAVMDPAGATALMAGAEQVAVPTEVEDYLLDLVARTRTDARFLRGVSPRGALALYRAARAKAFVAGRGFVVAEDVRALAAVVLGHRVVARVGPGNIAVQALLEAVPAPGMHRTG